MRILLAVALLSVGLATMVTNAQSGESPKLTDAQIFAIYDQVNGFDIETAELGAVKGHAQEVRQLAAMVLRDHSAVRQMTRDLAERLDVSYDVPEDDEAARAHAKVLADLRRLSGADFDRAYLAHEAQFHDTAINAVKTLLLPNVRSEAFKAQLNAVLPGFEHHLAETLATAKSLGYQ